MILIFATGLLGADVCDGAGVDDGDGDGNDDVNDMKSNVDAGLGEEPFISGTLSLLPNVSNCSKSSGSFSFEAGADCTTQIQYHEYIHRHKHKRSVVCHT